MHIRDLERLIATGEGEQLEFKHRAPRADRIAKEVVALANTRGGRLLLGVSDDGTIEGLRDVGEDGFILRQALQRHARPEVIYSTQLVLVDSEREILIVDVPESSKKPHFLVDTADAPRTIYIRKNDRSIEASRETFEQFQTELEPADSGVDFKDEQQVLMRYLDRYDRITVGQFARVANISRRQASDTLSILVQADVLRLHGHDRENFFTLSYDLSG